MEAEELGRYRRGPGAALGLRVVQSPLSFAFYPGPGGAGVGLWRPLSHPLPRARPGHKAGQREACARGGRGEVGPGPWGGPVGELGRAGGGVGLWGAMPRLCIAGEHGRGSAGFAVGEVGLTCGRDRREGRAWGCACLCAGGKRGGSWWVLAGGGLRAGPGAEEAGAGARSPLFAGVCGGAGKPRWEGASGFVGGLLRVRKLVCVWVVGACVRRGGFGNGFVWFFSSECVSSPYFFLFISSMN